MIALVIALAISLMTGWLLTRLWWPQPADDHTSLVLRIAVAAGIGLFASSLLTFTCLVLGIAQRPVIIGLDLAFLAVIAHVARKRDNATTFVPRAMRKLSSLDWVLGLGLVSALGIRASAWLARFDAQPLGFWDAFAIWNLKARFFFFAGGDHWIRAFSDAIVWSHTDYPILLPLNVARLWFYIGSPSQSASGLLSVVFVLLGVALLFGAIARPCGRTLAFGATFALLATPALMRQSVWQIADIPLSFYLSASLALVLAAGRCSRPNANLLMLAGLLAGCAAWTKNEGNLFAIAITVSIALVGVGNQFRDRATLALHFARGLALPLLVVAFMKISFAGESDLVTDFGADSLGRTLEFDDRRLVRSKPAQPRRHPVARCLDCTRGRRSISRDHAARPNGRSGDPRAGFATRRRLRSLPRYRSRSRLASRDFEPAPPGAVVAKRVAVDLHEPRDERREPLGEFEIRVTNHYGFHPRSIEADLELLIETFSG